VMAVLCFSKQSSEMAWRVTRWCRSEPICDEVGLSDVKVELGEELAAWSKSWSTASVPTSAALAVGVSGRGRGMGETVRGGEVQHTSLISPSPSSPCLRSFPLVSSNAEEHAACGWVVSVCVREDGMGGLSRVTCISCNVHSQSYIHGFKDPDTYMQEN
jgi:hypothetical protein